MTKDTVPTAEKRQAVATTAETERMVGITKGYGSKLVYCPICLDHLSKNNTLYFMCSMDGQIANHAFCYNCAMDYLVNELSSQNPMIKCPQCEHLLLPEEIAQILGRGDLAAGMRDERYVQLDELKRDFAIRSDPLLFATCPRPSCKFTVARSAKGAMDKATCPDCQFSFCTNCSHPYHYRSTCKQRISFNHQWRLWDTVDRAAYWGHDTAEQPDYKRIAHVMRVEAQDEQYKADNCRHCPHCNRLVEKIGDSCNLMFCGSDTDTGKNVQNGCLKVFDWKKAKRYQPVKASANGKYDIVSVGPKARVRVRHPYINCDVCRKNIVGMRFECINCPAYNVCEVCERENKHMEGHIFRIHGRSDRRDSSFTVQEIRLKYYVAALFCAVGCFCSIALYRSRAK